LLNNVRKIGGLILSRIIVLSSSVLLLGFVSPLKMCIQYNFYHLSFSSCFIQQLMAAGCLFFSVNLQLRSLGQIE